MFYIVGEYKDVWDADLAKAKVAQRIFDLTRMCVRRAENQDGNSAEFIVRCANSGFTFLTKEEIDNFGACDPCTSCSMFLFMSNDGVMRLFERHGVYIPVVISAAVVKGEPVLAGGISFGWTPSQVVHGTPAHVGGEMCSVEQEQTAALKYEIEKRDEEIAALKDRLLFSENKPINRDLSIVSPMDKWRMR